MSKSVQIFIAIHDQDILLDAESNNTYQHLPNYTYVFLGEEAIDKICHLENVVIARHLLNNIEEYKYLVSFTAWYAIAKNDLLLSDYVIILEYDVVIHQHFTEMINKTRQSHQNVMIGFKKHSLSHPLFLYATPYLITSLKKVYDINIVRLIESQLTAGRADWWACTSNYGLPAKIFQAFVDWFIPLTKEFREIPIGAHVHERCLPTYAILNSIETIVIPDILEHDQLKSHDIEAMGKEQTQSLIKEIKGAEK